MDDLISVIIPAYNAEKVIIRCLDSITKQTYRNLEIICIDDKSTDNTVKIIRSISDPRIKLIEHSQNVGISQVRNHGIEIAKGKYIGFVDSDDYVDADFFEKLHSAIVRYGSEIVSTATSVEWPNQTRLWQTKPQMAYDFVDKLRAVRNGSCWNKLYKAEFIHKYDIRFPAGLIHEDNLFIIYCLSYCSKLAIINDTKYHYVMSESSLTHNPQKARLRKNDSLVICKKIIDYVKEKHPKAKQAAITFIIKNIILLPYLLDPQYYGELRKSTGFSFRLWKAKLKALKKEWLRKKISFSFLWLTFVCS